MRLFPAAPTTALRQTPPSFFGMLCRRFRLYRGIGLRCCGNHLAPNRTEDPSKPFSREDAAPARILRGLILEPGKCILPLSWTISDRLRKTIFESGKAGFGFASDSNVPLMRYAP